MNDQIVSVRIEEANGSLLVSLSGEIDLSNAHQLQRQLETAIEGWPRVVIDLTEIAYLDSQGLRLIKQLCSQVDGDGAKLQLIAPTGSFTRQVLEMARIGDYAEIRDGLQD